VSGHGLSDTGVRRRRVLGLLASGVMILSLAAPADAIPVDEPIQIASGADADVTFDAVDRRYLIAHVSPGRGGFASSPVVSVAAEAAPSAGLVATAAATAQAVALAHDPARNRFLLAYFEVYSGFFPGPPRGLTIVLFEADGTRVAGPTLLASVGGAVDVAYNSRRGEYLVVYGASGGVAARRIDADGAPLGTEQLLVNGAQFPAVAYRPALDDYVLAVGRSLQPAQLRTLSPTGAQTAIAYSPSAREYLVVWVAADRERPEAGVRAIYGQHITGALRELPPQDFRVSVPAFRFGTLPCCPADEAWPAVVADTHLASYLAVWSNEFDPTFNRYRLMARRMTAVR
jgi:hypothetical protein